MNASAGSLPPTATTVCVIARGQTAPCVSWASAAVAPDETVLLIGDGPGTHRTIKVGRFEDEAS